MTPCSTKRQGHRNSCGRSHRQLQLEPRRRPSERRGAPRDPLTAGRRPLHPRDGSSLAHCRSRHQRTIAAQTRTQPPALRQWGGAALGGRSEGLSGSGSGFLSEEHHNQVDALFRFFGGAKLHHLVFSRT